MALSQPVRRRVHRTNGHEHAIGTSARW